ncbi:hypothetical protein CKAN_02010000 [Cinnamomum micranthum f. kanehirae]|uniref:Uncharacterized protein n=1 Tax=Cinnamomum micranthum f. kanehirae TaxID=337451 RepID=A0A3S3MW03_9MAGN|nr:hypothetical protein CKAN_02010000 [Cinnamomum micranthum f. kanehirae]
MGPTTSNHHYHLRVDSASSTISNFQATTPSTPLFGTELFYPEEEEAMEEVQADQPDNFLEYNTDGIV